MAKKGKRGRKKCKKLIISKTKGYFLVKQKTFSITFSKFYFDSQNKNSGHKALIVTIKFHTSKMLNLT